MLLGSPPAEGKERSRSQPLEKLGHGAVVTKASTDSLGSSEAGVALSSYGEEAGPLDPHVVPRRERGLGQMSL